MFDPRYPIGQFIRPQTLQMPHILAWIEDLAIIPAAMRQAVHGLDDAQLATPYRDGGWSLRQVVHHVPDSQMHAYLRFKMGLTELEPVIKPYDEVPTALLADYALPLEPSLVLLEQVHARWVAIARGLEAGQFDRVFVHPATGPWKLGEVLGLYAWHARHHIAHITVAREQHGF
jgi:hypothetical protein